MVATPREHDEQLAEMFNSLYRAEDQLAMTRGTILMYGGAKFYYRGRRRVTDMTLEDALSIVQQVVSDHAGESEYTRGMPSRSSSLGQYRDALERLEARSQEVSDTRERIAELEQSYTGWSRFFLVTSSPGHIHSSMHCSTCRPTTRYGWLPALSGKNEADAVTECGPTLCSVCFPSAPTNWTEGKKLTAAAAAKLAA